MFTFHCNTCEEKFNIYFENLYDKDTISCQNCGNQIPDEAIKSLKTFSNAYMDTIDTLYNSGTAKSSWSLSVNENNKIIPSKPGEYEDMFNPKRNKESYWQHRNST